MNSFILAAGLGTRLKPWTEHHPKALVPVGGVPMLERVLLRLRSEGFNNVVVNVHHFAGQIKDFLGTHDFGMDIQVSDESERLLDTGGGLLKALPLFGSDEPVLVHNVDILSDVPLADIIEIHKRSGRDISLVTSPRQSSRKLWFDADGALRGWHNLRDDSYRPANFHPDSSLHERAFSGIYVVNSGVASILREYADSLGDDKFPVMDFLLANAKTGAEGIDASKKVNIGEIGLESLDLIDIGKPETLSQAEALFDGSCR